MQSILASPTLDHAIIVARDQLDAASTRCRRLGFTLTPRGYHGHGSINHTIVFATDYIELIGVAPGKTDRDDLMRFPTGLHGLAFSTEDTDEIYARLIAAGLNIEPPHEVSRPVKFIGGTGMARFRTTRIQLSTTPAGRLLFCQQETRHLVWRDEWRSHPNGAVAIAGVVIRSKVPAALGDLFAQMFGWAAVRPIQGGLRLIAGLVSIDAVIPAEAAQRLGLPTAQATNHCDAMVALTLRSCSLEQTAACLREGNIDFTQTKTGIVVTSNPAVSTALMFIE